MLDEILDQENILLVSGTHTSSGLCWHRCLKNDQKFIFGLDAKEGGGYYLSRDGEMVAHGSKSALLSALERYGLLHEIDPKITQRIFMDVRC